MRALVIDDSRPIRGIIAKIMRGLNFETIEAQNGSEAWGILNEQGPFDVVTVNWEMPEMDGVQFATKVRRAVRYRNMPLLMISSIADTDRIGQAMNTGVDEYLVKPCTPGAITKKLKALGILAPELSASTQILQDGTGSRETRSRDLTGSKVIEKNPTPAKTSIHSRLSGQEKRKTGKSDTLAEPQREIRVVTIDDSSLVRNVIKTTLESFGGFKIVGAAADGCEGLEQIEMQRPDVVLLDIEMPRMDGLEMLRAMRSQGVRVPVVMFSSQTERGAKATTDALLLGAKDFVFKPGGARMSDLHAGEEVIRDQIAPRLKWLCSRGLPVSPSSNAIQPSKIVPSKTKPIELVVVAASTGGPAALATLFHDSSLRDLLKKPILVVQHMPTMFTKYLASRLAEETGLDIAEAVEGEVLQPGMIRIAPGGNHLEVNRTTGGYVTSINRSPPVNSCRPSADVLFGSAAQEVIGGVLGVMLTGMGHDGRDGCRAIREVGGAVIAQDEGTSVVWGMPGSVVAAGLANHVTPIELIGKKIGSYLRVGA